MSSSVKQTKAVGRDKRPHNTFTISNLYLTHHYLLPFLVMSRTPSKMVVLIVLLSCFVFVSAEHTGAYSSPQYAKKMYPTQGYENFETNALLPREQTKVPFRQSQEIRDRYDVANNTEEYGRASLLESAGSFLSGAGGHVMSNLAKDFIARSTGSSQVGFDCISQVLSLNLTNLVILVVLKALILAAGFFGAGAWKGHHYARSIDDNKNATFITSDEILLYLSYLSAASTEDYNCVYRVACEAPERAAAYSAAADLLLHMAHLYNGENDDLTKYDEIAKGLRKAAMWGDERMSCPARYPCGDDKQN